MNHVPETKNLSVPQEPGEFCLVLMVGGNIPNKTCSIKPTSCQCKSTPCRTFRRIGYNARSLLFIPCLSPKELRRKAGGSSPLTKYPGDFGESATSCWPRRQKKAQGLWPWAWVWRLAIPYFRTASCRTIIGARRFHFRVRDGSGWFTPAMVTKQFGVPGRARGGGAPPPLVPPVASSPPAKCAFGRRRSWARRGCPGAPIWKPVPSLSSRLLRHAPGKPIGRYRVKPHGQLVRVSCTHYWASTPRLSTS